MKPEATTFSEMNQEGDEVQPVQPSAEEPMALSQMQQQDKARPMSFIEMMSLPKRAADQQR